MSEIITKVQPITPAWAKEKLDALEKQQQSNGFRQRAPRERAIQRYAQDMKAGKWLLTHQGIAFDDEDHLIDGQNRLWAIYRSGVTIKLPVTTGIPAGTKPIDVIDSGAPRTIWQNLQLSHGYGVLAQEAQALARGIALMVVNAPNRPQVGQWGSIQISVHESLFILEEIGLITSLERLATIVTTRGLRRSQFNAPWALYHLKSPKQAEDFARAYQTLEEQKRGSPPLLLNRYFTTAKPRKSYLYHTSVTASALRSFDNGVPSEQLRGSQEAMTWLINLNKKACDAIFARVGK